MVKDIPTDVENVFVRFLLTFSFYVYFGFFILQLILTPVFTKLQRITMTVQSTNSFRHFEKQSSYQQTRTLNLR